MLLFISDLPDGCADHLPLLVLAGGPELHTHTHTNTHTHRLKTDGKRQATSLYLISHLS